MSDSDLSILSDINTTLSQNPDATQRDIAAQNGLSLGMTNAILRRFSAKGWILTKQISAKKICYMLTPEGMQLLAKRSYHYIQRTFDVINEYRNAVMDFVQGKKDDGITEIILIGNSDMEFLIEYACAE